MAQPLAMNWICKTQSFHHLLCLQVADRVLPLGPVQVVLLWQRLRHLQAPRRCVWWFLSLPHIWPAGTEMEVGE